MSACVALWHLQVFLAMQDRQIALRGKDNWYKDYYMPTPCDGLVIAGGQHGICWLCCAGPGLYVDNKGCSSAAAKHLSLQQEKHHWLAMQCHLVYAADACVRVCAAAARKWATEALKLPVSTSSSSAPAAAPASSGSNGASTAQPTAADLFSLSAAAAATTPAPSPQSINDRLKQHTEHCVICQKALQEEQFKLKAAQAVCAAALAGLVGVLSAVVLPGLVAKLTAAVTGSGAAAAAATPVVAWGPVTAAAVVLAAVAAAAAAIASSTAKLVEQFIYVQFSHAHNH